MRSKIGSFIGALALLFGVSVVVASQATANASLTWTGGGADANWSTAANWSPAQVPATADMLTFPAGAARLTNTNDLPANTGFNFVTFTGSGYSISGNPIGTPTLSQSSSGAMTEVVALPIVGLGQISQNAGSGSTLTLSGAITVTDNTSLEVINNQLVTISGVISGSGSGLTAAGVGRLVLSGNNPYTGATFEQAPNGSNGDVVINGNQPTSAVTVRTGLLEGIGTIGPLTAEQPTSVSPGDPVGTLHSGNLTLSPNSELLAELTGHSAGQFDQVAVTGTVSIDPSAVLTVTTDNFTPSVGQTFTIIANDGSDPTSGTFANLPEGAGFATSTAIFKITYKGGDGNDVDITATAPPPVSILTAPGSGGGPNVRSFGGRQLSFLAGQGTGGATVAAGNVLGGLLDDIVVGSGAGVPSRVIVYNPDGSQTSTSFSPYGDGFLGGVNVAVADVNGDGVDEIVTGAGPGGGPNVKVFDGSGRPLTSFFAYAQGFAGGVKVGAGDVDADGIDEIITGPGPGGGPNVRVFSANGSQQLASFFAYSANFLGGVNVAGADVNGDGTSEIVSGAGPGGGPHVRVFSGTTPLGPGFFAYDAGFVGGVNVGSFPDFGRGHDDIVTGVGPGGGPNVKAFLPDGSQINSFFAYDPRFTGGVNVAGAVLNAPQ